MSEVCVTYIQQVFCVIDEDTGEIERVVAEEDMRLADNDPECVYDLDTNSTSPAIPLDSERGRKAVEIAETAEWPARDL